ncbi:MAG: glycosyltransferase family 2 protein [Candidatus Margulisbacteria bacterium]|nr:glycosyltransferase family 2 protein [Candidatus Margulisiibacteriota bacterium]
MSPPVAVIIPALNEALAIGEVLKSIPKDHVRQIIVVDNGSEDNTSAIARTFHVDVIREHRKGYGNAVQAGVRVIKPDIEIVVVLDADFSDDPTQLPLLTGPIFSGEYDLVMSYRCPNLMKINAMPFIQKCGNLFVCKLVSLLYRVDFKDMGPFRAIRMRSLETLNLSDPSYGWNIEMQLKAIHHELRILEIPTSYRPRIGKSKISGTIIGTIKAGFIIILTCLKNLRW